MGLSVSTASAIIFISFVIIFGIVFGAFDNYQDSLIEANKENYQRLDELKGTEFSIISVDKQNNIIELKNLGETVIGVDELDVLVDGIYSTDSIMTMDVEGHAGSSIWAPGETLFIHMSSGLDKTRVRVISGNGISAYFV